MTMDNARFEAGSALPVTADQIETYRDEAAFLWTQRRDALDAPHYSPQQFADLDEQLAAQIDGLVEAGDEAWPPCQAALVNDCAEDFFVAGVLALNGRPHDWLPLVRRAREAPETAPGLAAALGWVGANEALKAEALMQADDSLSRRLTLEAYGAHRLDAGERWSVSMRSTNAGERARALRLAGELGRVDGLEPVLGLIADEKSEPRYWALWSGVLLGDRGKALAALTGAALRPGTRQMDAFRLAVLALPVQEGHRLLVEAETMAGAARLRIIGAGLSGQLRYVPWLIDQMVRPDVARIALEAFCLITGSDVNTDGLEAPPPDDVEEGPNDDPEDDDVAVPVDVALPWPDIEQVRAWWLAHQSRLPALAPDGRLFLGQPLSEVHCLRVLHGGRQRARALAALHLCLLRPGTPLFPVDAPTWRQRRLLQRLGGGTEACRSASRSTGPPTRWCTSSATASAWRPSPTSARRRVPAAPCPSRIPTSRNR
ncbi:TIGR02270 family protein [Roseateles chitinivorans]|uniref:TIGR02270 family protein n=1 Tax=Roseateles chitinivorans TaxID=2917965 RepID=UPI003D673FAC